MVCPSSPSSREPERGFALQKYLLLHSQNDALQKHLSQITPTTPIKDTHHRNVSVSSGSSSYSDEESCSPPSYYHHQHQRSDSVPRLQRPPIVTRRSSLPAIIDEKILYEIAEDETKIRTVNHQIKTTLTDLLNCESVKTDQRYRMWVQQRLMEAERELKGNRTRTRRTSESF